MTRYSIAAGIALGLAVAAYVSRVPPVNRPASAGRVVRLATVPAPNPPLGIPDPAPSIVVEFHGHRVRVSPLAHNIPYMMIGGETLSINGAVSRPYVSE
jgi:hypothetical protein